MAEQLDTQARGAPWLLQSAPLRIVSRDPTHLPTETLRPEGMLAGSFGGKFPHLEKETHQKTLLSLDLVMPEYGTWEFCSHSGDKN